MEGFNCLTLSKAIDFNINLQSYTEGGVQVFQSEHVVLALVSQTVGTAAPVRK